ncbi:acyltransferase [Mycolicibacterium sp. S2-37]|uniref:condensation domain-containing protein n=1 Tax=Mycolicibacterium sp. S2-37 TaxID=2810297 RepID=UPI001A94F290|nr:condensation domain-containing protein [Mycolicibacterium sp. S2-37]MBO0678427.1 acyltransferase [Mycolicibacterium sp. S2-37]
MRIGPLALGTPADWDPGSGSVVSWCPTDASLAAAAQAPVSEVPVSYMQDQHLRGIRDQEARGLDYSRLMIVACDAPGRCDVRAMTYVINTHLRRHDTYRSWFEHRGDGPIVRHTILDPADIEVAPTRHGELTAAQVRELVVSTPDPSHWDCFRFGIIQRAGGFTFFASIDHVHVDAMIVGVTLTEFYLMYASLVAGNQPVALPAVASYEEFCVRQHEMTSALTVDEPRVRRWTRFAEGNGGTLTRFPLPLGDPAVRHGAGIVTARVLDGEQTARFESACTMAGARFIGGVLACFGLAERELTGADTYYGLTPRDTRSTPAEWATQGWYTGLVPVTVPLAGAAFGAAAHAAQVSFDEGAELARVPYDRIRELHPELTRPRPNFPVVNYLDAGSPPLSVLLTADLGELNIGIYGDGRYSYQLCIYVIRVHEETAVAVMYPDNPVAQESVATYLDVLGSVFAEVSHEPEVSRSSGG